MADTYDMYLFQRAEIELERARRSEQPEVRHVHAEMASRYLERFYAARAITPRLARRD